MSATDVDILSTKLDILIDDFQSHKKLVMGILGGTLVFVMTSIVAVIVALIG